MVLKIKVLNDHDHRTLAHLNVLPVAPCRHRGIKYYFVGRDIDEEYTMLHLHQLAIGRLWHLGMRAEF